MDLCSNILIYTDGTASGVANLLNIPTTVETLKTLGNFVTFLTEDYSFLLKNVVLVLYLNQMERVVYSQASKQYISRCLPHKNCMI